MPNFTLIENCLLSAFITQYIIKFCLNCSNKPGGKISMEKLLNDNVSLQSIENLLRKKWVRAILICIACHAFRFGTRTPLRFPWNIAASTRSTFSRVVLHLISHARLLPTSLVCTKVLFRIRECIYYVRTSTDTRDALLLDYIFNPPLGHPTTPFLFILPVDVGITDRPTAIPAAYPLLSYSGWNYYAGDFICYICAPARCYKRADFRLG